MMKVTIIGTGYVGLVTGACLAEVGHHVLCLDVDSQKIHHLKQGNIPIYEPGLSELVSRNHAAGRLQFSLDIAASVEHGQIQCIAVGTPADEDGSADLQYVLCAARNIAKTMEGFKVIINKSTVPVGTANAISAVMKEELQKRMPTANRVPPAYTIVSNPEFLREGAAIEDFMRPDRILIGCDTTSAGLDARGLLTQLYRPFNPECIVWMDLCSAELTKYAANAMLATRISFMNEMANLAEHLGADIDAVRHGMGLDPRIGQSFLHAGCGYGGSCFPKDVQALIQTGHKHNQHLLILEAVEAVNAQQKQRLAKKVLDRLGNDLCGKRIAIWGCAFKPNTDDMRYAPSRPLIVTLLKQGAHLAVHDPVAIQVAKHVLACDLSHDKALSERLQFCTDAMEALTNADALVIVTEWAHYRHVDIDAMHGHMKQPLIFDGRNIYTPHIMRTQGFEYHGIGR